MDPMLEEYLRKIDAQKAQSRELTDKISQAAMERPTDYSPYAALAQATAQLGTIGGKTADTSSVARSAENLTNQAAQDKKLNLMALNEEQGDIDKQTGLNLKTLEYLQSRKDRASDKAADMNFRRDQLGQQRDLAMLNDQRYRDLASQQKADREIKLAQEKKPTADEFKAAGFAKRVGQSLTAMDKLVKSGYDRTSGLEGFKSYLPGALKNSTLQQQEQAERNFVNAVLRRESGAAISPTEFESAEVQYFPRTNDSPETLALKKQNREQAFNILAAEGGKAYGKIEDAVLAEVPKPAGQSGVALAASGPKPGDEEEGHVFLGGDPSDPKNWRTK